MCSEGQHCSCKHTAVVLTAESFGPLSGRGGREGREGERGKEREGREGEGGKGREGRGGREREGRRGREEGRGSREREISERPQPEHCTILRWLINNISDN